MNAESIKKFLKPDIRKIVIMLFLLFLLIFATDMDFAWNNFLIYLLEQYFVSCFLIFAWDKIRNKKSAK